MQVGFALKITIYTVIAFLSLVLICHFLNKGRRSLTLYSFIVFQALMILWALHDILYEIYRSLPYSVQYRNTVVTVIYAKTDIFIATTIPYFWLVFCISFANLRLGGRKGFLAALAIPPATFLFLHMTGVIRFVPLFEAGKVSLALTIYILMSYSYLILGIAVIIAGTWKQTGFIKKQALLLSFCLLLPLASSVIQNLRMYVFNSEYTVFGLDLTLVSFSITLITVAIASFRYRFLNVTPCAMKELFDHMEQPMVIADSYNTVIYVNSSFLRTFSGLMSINANDGMERLAAQLTEKARVSPGRNRIAEEIRRDRSTLLTDNLSFSGDSCRHYSVTVRPIFINNTDYAGKAVVFNDITKLVGMIDELNGKNEELTAKNRELKEYSATVEQLAVERERTRLTQDIHDTLGQSMTVLNTVLQSALISCDTDIAIAKEKLSVALMITKESMAELRKAVTGLKPGDLSPTDISHLLEILFKGYEESGISVALSVEGVRENISGRYTAFIFRLCQEAITNSLRHGRAKRVEIIIQTLGEHLRIFISDDGQGSEIFTKGQGLIGMEQRVSELNGRIWYGGNEGSGFSIYVELPACETIVQ